MIFTDTYNMLRNKKETRLQNSLSNKKAVIAQSQWRQNSDGFPMFYDIHAGFLCLRD